MDSAPDDGGARSIGAAPGQQQHMPREQQETCMQLSPGELAWAWGIKEAVEGIKELDNLSDFWYAQIALVEEQGDLEASLARIYRLQLFREEFNVADTLAEGCRELKNMIEMFPNHFLSFSYSQEYGSYCFVFDMAGWDVNSLVSSGAKVDRWIRSAYYFLNALSPDLAGVRTGISCIAECEGFGWHNISVNLYKKFWTDLCSIYPQNILQFKHFHSGYFTTMLYSMIKRVLPAKVREKLEMGCSFDGRLDKVYLVPTVEKANQLFLSRVQDTLRERHEREATFSLPPKPGRIDGDGDDFEILALEERGNGVELDTDDDSEV